MKATKKQIIFFIFVFILLFIILPFTVKSETYEVGEGMPYENISSVPWESLAEGDKVLIHYRDEPYIEKFVICANGTQDNPVEITGIPDEEGRLPVIDGRNATTRPETNFWNESRGVIKIGGANNPPCEIPEWIIIENLEIRSGRPPYTFTGRNGISEYSENAASIYVEVAKHLIIRNCIIHDSGNGLFIGAYDGETEDILIEKNWIYDNGIEGSIYEHNSYTSARGIVFQFNRYGPLREGCGGNNLKDRSAGLVVRYNWIEGGNRQLDLVDGEDTQAIPDDPLYRETFVYGNILIEPGDDGNSQIVHYGGDSGDESIYRKGTLYFYNNTVISERSGNTTLFRLSTNDEHCDARNNIVYVTAGGEHLAMLESSGRLEISHNWFSQGWRESHQSDFSGTITDDGTTVEGVLPGFENPAERNYILDESSPCINAGTSLSPETLPANDVIYQYVSHTNSEPRPYDPPLDIGAFERCISQTCEMEETEREFQQETIDSQEEILLENITMEPQRDSPIEEIVEGEIINEGSSGSGCGCSLTT